MVRLQTVEIGFNSQYIGYAQAPGTAMRPCPETEIWLVPPILQVMAALPSRVRPVGNLILFKTRSFESLPRPFVHVGGCIGIGNGEKTMLCPASKGRAMLNSQRVKG